MSVEPSEFANEVWTRLQGHVVNGVFPLGRYLGCSDHSGVFLTRSAGHPAEVAIKLVPTNRALAESQLPRWKRAGALAHPHLLRLFEWGGCQLEGLPYLYVVMEYADQTLAQLLQHRPLTEDEAREMLSPVLDVLEFLHSRGLVQGQLKPTNLLVVGEQLKLASDTIRRFSEGPVSGSAPTVYDPPESAHGGSSAAGDVWALGVTLFEALTRRRPPGLGEPRGAMAVPVDFSPAFRDVVVRSLALRPQDRLGVTDLLASSRGRAAGSAVPPEPRTPEPAPSPAAAAQVAPEQKRPAASAAESRKPPALLAVLLAAVAILALGWAGLHVLSTHRTPAPPPAQASGPTPPSPGVAAAAAQPRAPGKSEVAKPPSAAHEVVPDVPQSARRTIRGHIKVWVRVVVDQDGSVLTAAVDRTGPSRYFQQAAIDAARKWTFPVAGTPSRRTMQIRFDFSRDATTAHAVTLH
jgi:eukaryotic-like serine/threonine-protein kinase